MSDTDQWRSAPYVLIAHRSRPLMLVEATDGGWSAPRLSIQQLWKVPLDAINSELRRRFGIETTILRLLIQQRDETAKVVTSLRLLENRSPDWAPAAGLRWVGAAELDDVWFASPELRAAAAAGLADLAAGAAPALRAPWEQAGWYREAADWLIEAVRRLGHEPAGPVEQIKIWCISCVLRVATSGGTIYFKASNPSALMGDEARLTAGLARMFPGRVPEPLLVEPERRWMLLPDFGPQVGWGSAPEEREAVQAAFGRFQAATVGRVDELLAIGCVDRRLPWLADAIEPLLADEQTMAYLDDKQRRRLREAAPRLKELCARLDACEIPAALVHGDLHLDNVARRGDGYLVFDWTDACVSHPFFDAIDITGEKDDALRERLRDRYLAAWAAFAPAERLLEIWDIAGALSPLHQAVSYQALLNNTEEAAKSAFSVAIPYWCPQILAALDALG